MRLILLILCFCLVAKAQNYDEYFINHDFNKLTISKDEFYKYLQKVDELKLYNDSKWHKLLHFRKNSSEIYNDFEFFYTKDEKINPKYELYENIFQFFIDKKHYKGQSKKLNQENSEIKFSNDNDNLHFICRFPLRTLFIKNSLDIKKIDDLNCSDLDSFISYINPKSITVVFPASYISSPASMFGHSFLLINSQYNSKLVSYAINWAADVDEESENGIAFAFKGLFGGYYGKYSVKPYYDMLKTYKDNENRDLYEYDLNLSEEETKRLVLHLWEIKDTSSTYYFLNKNCSYNILWLLENAKDDLNIKNKFLFTVVPSNTIQKMDELKLIKNYTYRPSKLNNILNLSKELDYQKIKESKNIAKGEQNPNNDYLVLALANELSQYYTSKKEINLIDYQKITHKISTNLSKAPKQPLPKIKPKTSVIKSNYPSRLGFAYQRFDTLSINIRPAIHDIYEDDEGFDVGNGIEFLNTTFSINDKVRLSEFVLLNLISLADFNYINHRPSFMLNIKYSEILDKNSPNIEFLGGISKINDNFTLAFLSGGSIYNKGVSFNNKLIFQVPFKANKLSFIYNKNLYSNGKTADIYEGILHIKIAKNLALNYSHKYFQQTKNNDLKLGFYIYF